jgi:ATP-binding cassette, subfamily C, bacterial
VHGGRRRVTDLSLSVNGRPPGAPLAHDVAQAENGSGARDVPRARQITLGEFARELAHSAGWRLWWAIALIVLMPLTEGAGVALLLPTLQAAGLNLSGQGQAGRFAALIWGGFAAIGLVPGFLGLLALYVVAVAARTLIDRNQSVMIWTVQQNFADAWRRRLYRAIAGAQWRFITQSRPADFTHALTAELGRVAEAVSSALLLAGDLMLGALYIGLAFVLSPLTSAIVVGAGTVLALGLRGRTRRIERHGAELAAITNALYAAATEHLQSLKTAKTYGAEERNYALFADLSGRIAGTNVETAREQVAASSWFELGATLILMPLLYVAVRVIKVPPAELLLLLVLFMRVMPRIQSSHHHYRGYVNLLPSFSNVMALEERCRAAAEPLPMTADAPEFRSEIRFESVTFAYALKGPPAVRGLDLTIAAGKITALAGPSGAGKSTVADLVMGLCAPDAGRITVDGAALTPGAARAWRERIGYVGGETTLFHGTVRDNLRWAAPAASEAEMWEALGRAAAEFVRALPNGLDTAVGDRGATLSQGERQRIALARALLRRPALLILDEATNSLDYETEARVIGAIEALRGAITVLMIAHRRTSIRRADFIYLIADGGVVESGGWRELSASLEDEAEPRRQG